jgi:hypothetical protein
MVNYQFKKTLGFKASLQERKRKERRKILNQVNRRRRLELEVVQQGGGLFSGIGTGGFGTGGGAAIGGGGGLFGQSGSGSGTGGFGGGLGTGWIWWNEPVVKPSPAIASEDQLDTENRAHELRYHPLRPLPLARLYERAPSSLVGKLPRMRAELLDWLQSLCAHKGLSRQTFLTAVSHIDRYLFKNVSFLCPLSILFFRFFFLMKEERKNKDN